MKKKIKSRMEKYYKDKKKGLFIFVVVLSILLILYLIGTIALSLSLKKYDNKILPNVYVNDYNISGIKVNALDKKIDNISNDISSKQVTFIVNSKEYKYNLSSLGLKVDTEKVIKEIEDYHNSISLMDKIIKVYSKNKKVFNYKIIYDEEQINKLLQIIKNEVDVEGHDGYLNMDDNRNLVYTEAVPSYEFDVDKSKEAIINYINNGYKEDKLELIGSSNNYSDSLELKNINTKVSTFSSNYNRFIARGKNLENALRYLDGTIIKSGETFSYFSVAGPYNKKGYVVYDDVIGNGVCQIASTIYNTALLGGLQIVERHQHQKHMPYVPSGLDATVVSSGNSNLLDFKFKNTYKYPIYISAYYGGGTATVEFWSNSNAKEGKEYKTSFASLGNNTYQSYLHTYQNGQEISVTPIAKSRYIDY